MSDGQAVCLDELPELPTGWTKRMAMHLNFGGGKGSASYDVYDAEGRKVEGIAWGYNSRAGTNGFLLLRGDYPGYLSWSELRHAYAEDRRGLTGEQKP